MLIFMDILPSMAMTVRRFAPTIRIWFPLIAALTIAGSALAGDTAPSQVTQT